MESSGGFVIGALFGVLVAIAAVSFILAAQPTPATSIASIQTASASPQYTSWTCTQLKSAILEAQDTAEQLMYGLGSAGAATQYAKATYLYQFFHDNGCSW